MKMKIPCEECVSLAICIDPDKFYDIYYGCACPILEEAIIDASKLFNSVTRAAYKVHDWYKERTGIHI
jgi:hypothetical protein